MSPVLTDPLKLRRIARWRRAIIDSWQRQVRDVVVTGRLLIRAHDDLIPIHGAWTTMVTNDLPFSRFTAAKLMEIARHPVLANVSKWKHLPAAWTTLYELSKVEPATLEQMVATGTVTSATTIADVGRLRHSTATSTQHLAVIVSQVAIDRRIATVTAAITKFIDDLYRLIADGLITDAISTASSPASTAGSSY